MRTDRERAAATMRTINYGRDRHTAPNPRHSRRSWSRLKPHTAGSDWRSIRVSGSKSVACNCANKRYAKLLTKFPDRLFERKWLLRIIRNVINTFIAFLFVHDTHHGIYNRSYNFHLLNFFEDLIKFYKSLNWYPMCCVPLSLNSNRTRNDIFFRETSSRRTYIREVQFL